MYLFPPHDVSPFREYGVGPFRCLVQTDLEGVPGFLRNDKFAGSDALVASLP